MPETTRFLFLNRELSWLEFNRRVLEEAQDADNPLLERLKFLAITASNLDEFCMVRVGAMQQLIVRDHPRVDPSGMTPDQQLTAIAKKIKTMAEDQYACFSEIEKTIKEDHLRRMRVDELSPTLHDFIQNVFEHDIYPLLTPTAIETSTDFPTLQGLNINLAVRLKAPDGKSKKNRFAVICIPKKAGRFITLPIEEGHNFVLIEEAICEFVDRLFPGETILECVPFRLTRNADMSVREDQAGDLLHEMKEIISARKQSSCVRLEISETASKTLRAFLQNVLRVRDDYTFPIAGPLDLSAFVSIAKMTGFDDLRDKPWPPQPSPEIKPNKSIFEAVAQKDILLFHPYESFDPVVRLLEEAADDPDVLAIKQILYRTSERSPIIAALARAANNDKHVTAIVELKARFDEARNIGWAEALEQTGVQIIYGLKGLKTHAKLCLIMRREPSGIRRYVHFGTGNYNEITSRLYSDISYMTCQEEYGADATDFFNAITGYSQPVTFRKLEAAPIGLRARFLELIESEIQRQQQGQKTLIMAKVNSLVDQEIIEALYKASQAGVKILLNVRGICCLKPGIPKLSETISVVSIVDRFLEHSRIFYFHHGGQPRVYISSADWMPRNLDRRVELLVPIDDETGKARLIRILQTHFKDNVKSRVLQTDGTYQRLKPAGQEKPLRSQELFYQQACDASRRAQKQSYVVFEPQRPLYNRM